MTEPQEPKWQPDGERRPSRARPSAFYSERPVWQLLAIIVLLIGLVLVIQKYG